MDVHRKTALVLSGGGITGFLFEIGVLAALEEALPQTPLHLSPLDVAVAHGAGVIVHVNLLVPLYNGPTTLCLPLDGGHCASLAEKGVGWIGEQAVRI